MAWTVAALVIVINGYLLLDFFIAEVRGLLFGFLVCTATAGYVAFIVYLIYRGGSQSSSWQKIELTKRISCTES